MEKNRSKIHQMLKKVSSTNIKHYHVSPNEGSHPLSGNSLKKSYQATPLKSSIKHSNQNISKIITGSTKIHKHILNKTVYGTPS